MQLGLGAGAPEQTGICVLSGFFWHSEPPGQELTGSHSVQLKLAVLPLHAAVCLPSQP